MPRSGRAAAQARECVLELMHPASHTRRPGCVSDPAYPVRMAVKREAKVRVIRKAPEQTKIAGGPDPIQAKSRDPIRWDSRRLAASSDNVRPEKLDLAMLLALEAGEQADTLEARGSLQRSLEARPEVARFFHVPEGHVINVAYGTDGRMAAGYPAGDAGNGYTNCGSVLFGPKGERTRIILPTVEEAGSFNNLAFGPDGRIVVAYSNGSQDGLLMVFDARGVAGLAQAWQKFEKAGWVTSVAFGKPDGRIAAGYSGAYRQRRWRSGGLQRPRRCSSTSRLWVSRGLSSAWPSDLKAGSPPDIPTATARPMRAVCGISIPVPSTVEWWSSGRSGRATPGPSLWKSRKTTGQPRGILARRPDRRGIFRQRRP